MAELGSPPRQPGLVLSASAIALAAAILSAVLVVNDQRVGGFSAALVAACLLIVVGRSVKGTGDGKLRFAASLAEQGVDAIILGTLAWVAFPADPHVAAAALAALVASYLASYLRARAVGLGFRLEEALLLRFARMALVALGILDAFAPISLWVATGLSAQTIMVRAAAVARQKEPR